MSNQHLFLPQHGHYSHLRVYKVVEALYDLTYLFCQRFLPPYGDRTVDQMVQAARSGKQNIAEGNQAAATSSETEIKLTNVARASLEELLDDYEDYLRTRSLPIWGMQHPRMASLRQWTRSKAFFDQYKDKGTQLTDEEFANLCITLCHQAIYMLGQLLKTQQNRFVTEGGIKEQMHKARTGYRQQQDAELETLRQENATLHQQVAELEARLREMSNLSNQNIQNIQSNQSNQSNQNNQNNQSF
ncbi:MAG: four helix bundle suffix domain-containing protein [Bacteroidales bacterium]|nr:four helix bundle suffix domain-containing protein [Bacteroidales bacterium]